MNARAHHQSLLVPIIQATDVARFGRKAFGLSSLMRAGAPVPTGFVIPVSVFRDHIDNIREEDFTLPDMASAVLAAPLSPELTLALREALTALMPGAIAVRSSATIEDSQSASFAGIFATVLDVRDLRALQDAVRQVWASACSDIVSKYRGARAADTGDIDVAVIVQKQLEPSASGVAFSKDPLGVSGAIYVEWVRGLGEALVSGERIDGRCWLTDAGDILRSDWLSDRPGSDPNAPSLRELASVVKTAQSAVEAADGVDVEWAIENDRVYALQARPITIHNATAHASPVVPWQLPGIPTGGWTDDQRSKFDLWDEYNPRAIYPLEFDLWMAHIWQASIDMLDRNGRGPSIYAHTVSLDEVPIAIDPAGRVAHMRDHRLPKLPNLEEALALAAALSAKVPSERTLSAISRPELLQLIFQLSEAHAQINVTRLLHMSDWIDGERNSVACMTSALKRDVAQQELDDLATGIEHQTAKMQKRFRSLLSRRDIGNSDSTLTEFVKDFGHFEFDGTMIFDEPDIVLKQVECASSETSVDDTKSAVDRSSDRATALLTEVQDAVNRAALASAIDDYRKWYALRENSKTEINLLKVPIRRACNALAQSLNEIGLWNRSDDIRLATSGELQRLVHLEPLAPHLPERRRALMSWKLNKSWLPESFLKQGLWSENGVFRAEAGGPGVGEGPARLIESPDQFANVQTGDIVVARATNPIWTQLFGRIAGIVVENGSRLSHAAVTAREFGLPAVVGANGIFETLKQGERIRIDGNVGEVRRI